MLVHKACLPASPQQQASQARDPKDEQIRIKEREAKRKMKGITLQYTEEERVFFNDVAGIGDAKVPPQRSSGVAAMVESRRYIFELCQDACYNPQTSGAPCPQVDRKCTSPTALLLAPCVR